MNHSIKTGSLACLFLISLCLGVAAAAAKPNFSGVWLLDKGRSEGLPPDVKDQTLAVVQSEDKISLETTIIRESGEIKQSDAYILSGKEVDFKPQAIMGIEGKGRRTARWAADGNSVEVHDTATYESPEGSVDVQIDRKWTLSADGKSLFIELNVNSPQGTMHMKRVFAKK